MLMLISYAGAYKYANKYMYKKFQTCSLTRNKAQKQEIQQNMNIEKNQFKDFISKNNLFKCKLVLNTCIYSSKIQNKVNIKHFICIT